MKPRYNQLFTTTALMVITLSSSALAQSEWNGSANTNWNDPANWSAGVPAGVNAVINVTPANIATIFEDPSATPVDILVGSGVGSDGRLDHTAGAASTGAGNWMFVGSNGGTGVYNLTGTGSMNVGGRLYVGGSDGPGGNNGIVNMDTTGSLALGGLLQVGTRADSTGVFNLTAGAVTTNGWTEFGNFGGNGTLNMSGGSLTQSGGNPMIFATNASTGAANITGGSLAASNGLWVGNGVGSSGSLVMSAGVIDKTGGDHFVIGREGGVGVADISGGSITVNNEIWVGQNAGSTGTLTFSAGTITNNSWVAIGRSGGQGTVDMTGGIWNKTGESNFIVGASGTGITSTMNMSGGAVNVAPHANADRGITWIGEQSGVTGVLNLSGSAEFNTEQMVLGVAGGSTGIVNLDGGTLGTSQLAGGAGTANVSFNGTQIIATADRTDFIANLDQATITDGGLLIDSQDFDVGSNQAFDGSGGLAKSGTGTLTLSANSTYTGATVVEEGMLLVMGNLDGTSGASVADGASLGGNGIIAGLSVVASGGTISPGPSVATIGFTGLDLQGGSVYLAELTGNGINDLINVAEDLTIDGMIQVLLGYSPAAGDTFDLANFTSFSGTPQFDFSQAALDPGLEWDTTDFTTNGVISVVPEPSAGLLGLFGAALLLRRRR